MNRDAWPDRIKALPYDEKTGYPIPYVVLVDKEDVPHFKINDGIKELECLAKKLCHICGQPLKGEYWFVGGQLSAYHPKGVFNDGAVHHECAVFAMKVCPYLANSDYYIKDTDASLRRKEKQLENKLEKPVKLFDPTQKIRARLTFHCLVKAKDYIVNPATIGHPVKTVSPKKPYQQVEFYVDGRRIHKAEAKQMMKDKNEQSYLP